MTTFANIHICTNFRQRDIGQVFVWTDDMDTWNRMSFQSAVEQNKRVIKCSYCQEKPAQTIDHFFPYYIEQNLCDDCAKFGVFK